MADQFILDSLVIELTGDDTGYKNTMRDAEKETTRASESLKSVLGKSIEEVNRSLLNLSSSLGTASSNIAKSTEKLNSSITQTNTNLQGIGANAKESGATGVSAFNALGTSIVAVTGMLYGMGYAITRVFSLFVSGIKEIEKVDSQARKLGITFNELRTIQVWGGISSREAVQAISTIQTKLTEARLGSIAARQSLSTLARESGSSIDARNFRDVITQLENIKSPADRAAQAFRLMGSNATILLDKLGNAGGLRQVEGFARRSGILVTDADLANTKAVGQTIREIQTLWDGFINQVILGISPFARALSEVFNPKNLDLRWIRNAIFDTVHGVILFGAFLLEAAKGGAVLRESVSLMTSVAQAGFLKLESIALNTIKRIADATVNLFKVVIVGNLIELGKVEGREAGPLNKVLQGIGKFAAGIAITNLPNLESGEFLGNRAEKANKQADSILDKLPGRIKSLMDTLKLSEYGKIAEDIAAKAKKFRDEATGGFDAIKEGNIKLIQAMTTQVDTLQKRLMTPQEKFIQEATQLWNLRGSRNIIDEVQSRKLGLGENVIIRDLLKALPKNQRDLLDSPFWSARTFGSMREAKSITGPDVLGKVPGLEQRAAFGILENLLSAVRYQPISNVAPALQYRTQEAVTAETQFRMAGQRPDIQEQIRRALEIAVEQRERQIKLGDQVLTAIGRLSSNMNLKKLFDLFGE